VAKELFNPKPISFKRVYYSIFNEVIDLKSSLKINFRKEVFENGKGCTKLQTNTKQWGNFYGIFFCKLF